MFDQGRALESAMPSSESYTTPQPSFNAAISSAHVASQPDTSPDDCISAAAQSEDQKCFF